MGALYKACTAVTGELEARHAGDAIGLVRAKGALATRTGFLVSMVWPNDADDPEKLMRLRTAAAELGIRV